MNQPTRTAAGRTVAAHLGRVAAAVGWVALAYVFVLVVAACSVTVEPAGGDTTPTPEPVERSTGYSHDYKASLLRDLARNDDNLCYLYDQNGAESVARILNRADTDVEFNRFVVRSVLSEECDQ